MKALTRSESKTLRAMKGGLPIEEAVGKGYNVSTKASARTIANRLMKRERFIKVLERAGLTDQKIAEAFVEGLKATKAVVVDKQIVDYPDYNTRHTVVKTGLKVKGYLQDAEASTDKGEPLIVQAVQFKNSNVQINTTKASEEI